jgi:hypothetical protein
MIVGKNYILVVVENSNWKFYKDLIIVKNMNLVINKINIFLQLRNFYQIFYWLYTWRSENIIFLFSTMINKTNRVINYFTVIGIGKRLEP